MGRGKLLTIKVYQLTRAGCIKNKANASHLVKAEYELVTNFISLTVISYLVLQPKMEV